MLKHYLDTSELADNGILNEEFGVMVSLSGGMDSALVLYQLARDLPKEVPLSAHHVFFENWQNRQNAEAFACREIVKEINLIRKIQYSESRMFISCSHASTWYTVPLMVANHALSEGIFCVADGRRLYHGQGSNITALCAAWDQGDKLYELLLPNAKVLTPILHHTKSKVYEQLPKSLQDITWSCRNPMSDKGKYTACGECVACKDLSKFKVPHRTI